MSVRIDWPSKVIFIPKSYMTLIRRRPYEVMELDVNQLHLDLRGLEASEQGMLWDHTHEHETPKTVSKSTVPRIVKIVNGYTITFEPGQYDVLIDKLISITNIDEVLNPNQVSIRITKSYTDQELLDLIGQGESYTVEFKKTLLYDIDNQKESKHTIPLMCFKTIAGFMNTCGGILYIGVKDSTQEPVGPEHDFEILKKKSRRQINPKDQFEQRFQDLHEKFRLDRKFWHLINSEFKELNGMTVYVVQVQQANNHVFLGKKGDFYIREPKATRRIESSEISAHWGNRNLFCD